MVKHDGAERSKTIRERVIAARALQTQRFEGNAITCNNEILSSAMRRHCKLDDDALRLLANASAKRQFSPTRQFRITAQNPYPWDSSGRVEMTLSKRCCVSMRTTARSRFRGRWKTRL
jgi:Magnesium chelatase, subunit ChlI C-terminal